jgi:endonuclease G, mitochondrial
LPEHLEDAGAVIPVDVIERSYAPHYEVDVAEDFETDLIEQDTARERRLDVVAPGCSISNIRSTAGTAGAVVFDASTGMHLVLSNWHVLHGPSGNLGDDIVQPGRIDDPNIENNRIGKLVRSHLGLDGDCAVASLEQRSSQPEIMDLGFAPKRTAHPRMAKSVPEVTPVAYGLLIRRGMIVILRLASISQERAIRPYRLSTLWRVLFEPSSKLST